MSALVLLSGGADSSTALAESAERGPVTGLFVAYGQRHIAEHAAARAIAAHYGAPLIEFTLPDYGELVASSLTGHGDIPIGGYDRETMGSTEVPNRNAVLASIAAGVAAGRGIGEVVLAVHGGDHFIYPDCRPGFVAAIDEATRLSCGVRVRAPFVGLDKAQIVARGAAIGVPYRLTWSCYVGGEDHCGRCGTCVERRDAFARAGVPDPTRYAR